MNNDEFRHWSRRAADGAPTTATHFATGRCGRVVKPGDIFRSIEASPPEDAERWTGSSPTSRRRSAGDDTLAASALFCLFPGECRAGLGGGGVSGVGDGAHCMLWQTSPAATELETRTVDWMRQALGCRKASPGLSRIRPRRRHWAAVLTMRERALDWQGNKRGLAGQARLRIYSSDQVHYLDRPGNLGVGHRPRGQSRAHPGRRPLSRHGYRGPRSGNRRRPEAECCRGHHRLRWRHSAQGGTTTLRRLRGGETAWALSSRRCGLGGIGDDLPGIPAFLGPASKAPIPIVFNPHKWLGAQFDCSIPVPARSESHVRTLAIISRTI